MWFFSIFSDHAHISATETSKTDFNRDCLVDTLTMLTWRDICNFGTAQAMKAMKTMKADPVGIREGEKYGQSGGPSYMFDEDFCNTIDGRNPALPGRYRFFCNSVTS